MTALATPTPLAVETAPLETVTFDAYRDIHKGLRHALFAVTGAAGRVDPGDRSAVAAVAEEWSAIVRLLVTHAEHEDEYLQPLVRKADAGLAAVIERDHPALEGQIASLEVLADRARDASHAERRGLVHRLYLGLASFTAEYVEHLAFEELEVAPALAAAYPVEEIIAVDRELVASIEPEMMVAAMRWMIPAMNLEDRVELLGGMQAGAPAEVFDGVRGLAESVLSPQDSRALAQRLGLA